MTTTPDPNLTGYVYDGQIIRWVDGDTCDMTLSMTAEVDFDFGFRFIVRESRTYTFTARFRMWGINTPEHGQPNYAESVAFVNAHAPAESHVKVRTYKPTEKYGRWLADIQVPGEAATINAELVEAHLANPYFGGTK